MKLGRRFPGYLITLLATCTAVLPACTADDTGIVIYAVRPMGISVSDDGSPPSCKISTEYEEIFCGSGLLDIDSSFWQDPTVNTNPYYLLVLEIHNYLVNNANTEIGQLDTHKFRIERFEVRYEWEGEAGNALIDSDPNLGVLRLLEEQDVASVEFVGDNVLDSSDGTSPSKHVILMEAIPGDVGSVLSSALDSQPGDVFDKLILGLYIKVVGSTLGGTHHESAEFHFPVQFCDGCLWQGNRASGASCFPWQEPYGAGCLEEE